MEVEHGTNRVITHIKPDTTLEGRVNSYVDVIVWKKDKKQNCLVEPKRITLVVPRRFPTKHYRKSQLNQKEEHITRRMDLLRNTIKTDYETKIEKKDQQLQKYKKHTSKGAIKLLYEISLLEKAIIGLPNDITFSGPFKNQGRFVFIIETSHLDTDQLSLLNPFYQYNERFTKTTDLVERTLNGCFNQLLFLNKTTVDMENFTEGLPTTYFFQSKDFPNSVKNQFQKARMDTLLNSTGLAIDFETTEWKPAKINEEDKELDVEELVKKFDLDDSLSSLLKQELLDKVESAKDSSRNERIVTATLCDVNNGNYFVVSTLPLSESIDVKFPGKDITINPELYQAKDQIGLIEKVNEIIKEIQPLYMFGHKHTDFDYRIAQELPGTFEVGINGEKPEYLWGLPNKFMQVRIAPGRMDIEPSSYYQHFSWIRNNKLDTVFEDVVGRTDKKAFNHEQLEEAIRSIESGKRISNKKRELADKLNSYAMSDSIKSYIICSSLLGEILETAYLFNTTSVRVCTTSKKTLTEEYWTQKSLDNAGTFLYKDPQREFISSAPILKNLYRGNKDIYWKDFNIEDFQERLIKLYSGKSLVKKGMAEGKLIFFHPHVEAMKDFFLDDVNAKKLYNSKFGDDKKKKIRQYKALEAIIEYPFFKVVNYSNNKLVDFSKLEDDSLEKRFSAEFRRGFSGHNLRDYHNKLVNYSKSLVRGLNSQVVVNHQGNFYMIQDSDSIDEFCGKIEEYNFGTVLGDVTALSLKKGVFGLSLDEQLLVYGLADPKSNKGEKNLLTKELIGETLKKILVQDDIKGLLKLIRDTSCDIQNGVIDDEKLVYEREVKRHFTDYSDMATQPYISLLVEQQLRQGETLRYYKDSSQLLEDLFGVRVLDKDYTLVNRSIIRSMVEATVPIANNFSQKDKNFVKDTIGNVLAGQATDEEIIRLVDDVYNSN